MPGSNLVQVGIDLSEFYLSVEWDILEVPATKNEEYYPDTLEPFSGELLHSFCGWLVICKFDVCCRYYLQVDHAAQNVVLYGEFDCALRGINFSHRFGLLSAQRFGRKGKNAKKGNCKKHAWTFDNLRGINFCMWHVVIPKYVDGIIFECKSFIIKDCLFFKYM